MTRGIRYSFFALSALGFLSLLVWGLRGVPPLGHYHGPYGDVLNQVATYERHITDIVTAVNFDYRGFDTLGEEFILFISVMGVTLLLRKEEHANEEDEGAAGGQQSQYAGTGEGSGESGSGGSGSGQFDDHRDKTPERSAPSPSDATRTLTLALVGPIVLFGIYVVVHGQLTPGGGFQGGVILATAPLLVYLAGNFKSFKRIVSHTMVEIADGIGAGGYALIGLAGLAVGGMFLQNVFPLGTTGSVNSAGSVALIDLAVGLEVSSAFVLLLYAFLEETLARLEERENK